MKQPPHIALRVLSLLAMGACLLAGGPAQAQTAPTLTPARNGYVARTGSVGAELSGVLLKRNSRAALRVFGTQGGGRKAGTTAVVGGQLSFTPTTGFAAGETVWATLDRTAVYDTTQAQPLSSSQVWQLTASAAPSSGQLTPQTWLATTYLPRVIATGDVDADGDLDVLAGYQTVAGPSNSVLAVRLNDGTGTFFPAADLALPFLVTGLSLGDVDGDGDLDGVVMGLTSVGTVNTGKYVVITNLGADGLSVGPAQTLAGAPAARPTLADLDGDGDLDWLSSVAKPTGPVQVVYLNAGGTFSAAPATAVPAAVYGHDAAVGDLDNDGDLDVVACDSYSSTTLSRLAVRLNNGAGTFSSGPTSVVASNLTDPRLADVDGDGDLDAIVTHDPGTGSATVRVWLNQGNAQFVAGTVLAVSGSVSGLTVADLDGDNDLDLLYGTRNSLVKSLNPGNGAFVVSTTQPLDDFAEKLAAGDVDGDGDVDVLAGVKYATVRNAVLLLRNGPAPAPPYTVASVAPAANRLAARAAQPAALFSTPMGSVSAAVIRATGSMGRGQVAGSAGVAGSTVALVPAAPFVPGELVTVSVSKAARSAAGVPLSRPYVWQFVAAAASGTGQFVVGPPRYFAAGTLLVPNTLRLADLDGDGDLDLITSLDRFSGTRDTLLSLRRNDGRGNFAAPVPLLSATMVATTIELADVDGDGDLDVLGNVRQYPGGGSYGPVLSRVWLNNGAAVFQAQGTVENPVLVSASTSNDYGGWSVGDLNGDGRPDLMNGGVRLGDGQGNFYGAGELPAANYLRSSALADLDGDGDLDCVMNNDYNDYFIHFNDGSGHLSTGVGLSANTRSNCVVLRDLDNDGDPDMLIQASPWLNDGQGHFAPSPGNPQNIYGLAQAVGDVNSDGLPDIFTTQGYYLNVGQGQFAAPTPQPLVGNSTLGVLGDVDGDGDLDYVTVSQGNGAWWRVYYNGGQALATTAPLVQAGLAAWPSPVASSGQLQLALPQSGPATLTLHTMLGQVAWVQTVRDTATPVPMGHVAPGVYVLTVQQPGAPPRTQRLTVE